MSQISICHVKSSYGKKQVLTDISIEVEAGKCVGIIGANGCGKTTLLSIIAGIRKPQEGIVFIPEQVGYVPQESILIPELTVWDNLLLWHVDKTILQKEIETGFLNVLGLDEIKKTKISKLSGGQRKRVSIGCAMAGNPDVLVMDEPGAALDLPGKGEVKKYLELFKRMGGTIVLTTHDESELALCDKIYVLFNGICKEIDISLRGEELNKLMQL